MSFLGAEASTVVSTVLNPALPILSQFTGLSLAAYGFVKAVSAGIATLNGILPNVVNPNNSTLAAIQFSPNLPGMAVQAAAQCCERYTIWRSSLANNPTNWSATILNDFSSLPTATLQSGTSAGAPSASPAAQVSAITLPKLLWFQAAAAAALALASIYDADQANWVAAQQNSLENAFDMLGNYVYPDQPAAQLMDQIDLQQTLSDVRTIIESAIDFMRANDVAPSCVAGDIEGAGSSFDSLKGMALALQTQVESEILERDTLLQVIINNPLPLPLICLMYGLPYNTAEQLWAVNKLSNPNAVSGQIYVYQPGTGT
jgi:hypothetical protein